VGETVIQQGLADWWNQRNNQRKPPQSPTHLQIKTSLCRPANRCKAKDRVIFQKFLGKKKAFLTKFSDQDSPVGATMKNTFFKNIFKLPNEVSVFQKL
jgi:hypothetical protein